MGKRVIVLGGGVAGLSAAHELVERGFDVDVWEARGTLGGKARSMPFSDSDAPTSFDADDKDQEILHWAGRRELPSEHGFRFFPGFYRHVIDTMARIPTGHGTMVSDNLVSTTRVLMTQFEQEPVLLPARFPDDVATFATVLRAIGQISSPALPLRPDDLAFFSSKIWQVMTSCEARRFNEYEKIGWWDFVEADKRSVSYQKFLASGMTRSLVAAKARKASTRTIGDMFTQIPFGILLPSATSTDRVLNGPTSAVWIYPWRRYLEQRGVRIHRCAPVEGLSVQDGRIESVRVRVEGRLQAIRADWYVLAIPIERAAPLMGSAIVSADPGLANLRALAENVDWMNGIQFYLRRDVPVSHGHAIHIDTPWALTSISQAQFWRGVDLTKWSDGHVRGILSVDVSDWTAPGLRGKTAQQCTREEIISEVWEQLKRSMNVGGRVLLRDSDLHTAAMDPDIQRSPTDPSGWENLEPLLVNLVDTWKLRPDAVTRIPNLFLASDYVRTYTDLATMEGANEAARRAVNGIIAASGVCAAPCALWKLHEPDALVPLKAYDEMRFQQGLPWDPRLVDSAMQVLSSADDSGMLQPLLDLAHALGEAASPLADPPEIGSPGASSAPAVPSVPSGVASLVHPEDALAPSSVIASGPLLSTPRLTPTPADAPVFSERLSELGNRTREFLLEWLPRGEPDRHLYGPLRQVIESGGKGLRPALLLATTSALGGNQQRALPAAAVVELLHQSFLVHDDIEDGSELRRGRPALYRREGVPMAINHGDALNALALRLFSQNLLGWGPQLGPRLMSELDTLLVESLEGQASELGWIRDNTNVSEADVLGMMRQKTASYSFIHPLRMGGLIARPDIDPSRFDALGEALGLAFQIQDDVLNLHGDEAAYGKEIGGDLYEGKRTVPLVHLLGRLKGRDREWLTDFLGRPRSRRLPREVDQILEWMRREGSLEYGRVVAEQFIARARTTFESALSDAIEGPDLGFLRGLIQYVIERDR